MMGMVLGAALAAGAVQAPGADAAQTAAAGQRLGQCMVLRTTGADRITVARWFLGVMASTPQAADVTTLANGRKPVLDRDMAALFTRLLVKDCSAESKPLFALPGRGGEGFRIAGEALGRVAMEELLGNPKAKAALEAYTGYLKPEDFKSLMP